MNLCLRCTEAPVEPGYDLCGDCITETVETAEDEPAPRPVATINVAGGLL